MDDPTSTSMGEKDTSLSLQPDAHFSDEHKDVDPSFPEPISSPAQQIRRNLHRKPGARYLSAYGAMLVMSLPVVPIVASVITIIIYLSNPYLPNWLSLVLGAGSTCVVWLAVSFFLAPLMYAKNANAGSYGTLESRLQQLEARLLTIRNESPDERVLPEYQQVALNEAYDKLQEITDDLYQANSCLPWALGFGYVNAWRKLHRAEEALVEVEPQEMVMRGAMHDKMAISGSQISNRDELLAKLRYAAKKLDLNMAELFKPWTMSAIPGEDENPDLLKLQQDVQKIAHTLKVNLSETVDDNQGGGPGTQASDDSKDQVKARMTLQEVRRALNAYRDHLYEGLIRARNNLLGSTFVTGLGTYILLSVAILALASDPHSRSIIIAAASYYLVGALAGLFARISQATLNNIEADDYGFSLALILSRPLYSGLAGLGGVLVSSTVLSISTQSPQNPVLAVFTPGKLDFLIVAAAFGLTPGLILGGLQNQTMKMLSALSSSKTANTAIDRNINEEYVFTPPYRSGDEVTKERETNQLISAVAGDKTSGAENALSSHSESSGKAAKEKQTGQSPLPFDEPLDLDFEHNFSQMTRWFRISAIAAMAGLLLLLGGVITAFTGYFLIGLVTVIAGGLIESVAAITFQQVRKANRLVERTSERMYEVLEKDQDSSTLDKTLT